MRIEFQQRAIENEESTDSNNYNNDIESQPRRNENQRNNSIIPKFCIDANVVLLHIKEQIIYLATKNKKTLERRDT